MRELWPLKKMYQDENIILDPTISYIGKSAGQREPGFNKLKRTPHISMNTSTYLSNKKGNIEVIQ